jgi:uncharacterized membrane protein HdeD (DUF308 family)
MLADILSRYWWMTALRGAAWVLFGLAVLTWPGLSLIILTFMFGIFVLVDGVSATMTAIGGRHESSSWWVLLLVGLCGIAVGVMTFFTPGLTALALLLYIAAWAIATGILQTVTAIRLRREIEGEFWLALSGILSVLFGLLILARPGAGALSVVWLIGLYAMVFGLMLVVLAFRVRTFVHA